MTETQTCPHISRKPYPIPLKHHKFMKEEIKNVLEARLIERFMCPCVVPIIVVPRKRKPEAPVAETKKLVIAYCELNKKMPKVQIHKQNQEAF